MLFFRFKKKAGNRFNRFASSEWKWNIFSSFYWWNNW